MKKSERKLNKVLFSHLFWADFSQLNLSTVSNTKKTKKQKKTRPTTMSFRLWLLNLTRLNPLTEAPLRPQQVCYLRMADSLL